MNMPIHSFQDILEAMERDPALRDALRRHILTNELLQVPARLDRIEGDLATIKDDVSILKDDVAVLKDDVAVLKGDVSSLKEGQARLEERVGRIGGDVSRLTGNDYESHVADLIHRFLRRERGIAATVFSTQREKSALRALIDEAETQGVIQAWETDDLDHADLVLSTAGGATDYLLAEVSITIQQDDIDRADERAKLLAKATGRSVTPFAVGAGEEPDLNRGNVQVLLIPYRRDP